MSRRGILKFRLSTKLISGHLLWIGFWSKFPLPAPIENSEEPAIIPTRSGRDRRFQTLPHESQVTPQRIKLISK